MKSSERNKPCPGGCGKKAKRCACPPPPAPPPLSPDEVELIRELEYRRARRARLHLAALVAFASART